MNGRFRPGVSGNPAKRFQPGISGNPTGRPKTFSIHQHVAEAIDDKDTRTEAVQRLRDNLKRAKAVVNTLEFAARVNREIGLNSDAPTGGVTILFQSDPSHDFPPVNSFASPYLLTGLARCSVCGASLVVLTRDFKSERRPFYACSYHHHRGAVVCPNGLPAEMQATNLEVLTSIRSRLARRTVVEQAIEMALADLVPQRDARAAEHEALTTRLRQLEAEMERLTAAVAEGGELPTLLAALKGREGQRVECRRRLEALGEGVHPLDLKRAERRIRERLRDATRLLERQVGPARGILRELLADRIAFTPHVEAEHRWYEFAGQITPGGLLAGVIPQAMVTPAGSARFRLTVPLRTVFRRAA